MRATHRRLACNAKLFGVYMTTTKREQNLVKPVSIAFFDAKPYDITYFTESNKEFKYNIDFYESHLNSQTASLAQGHDIVCAFVNDKIDANTAEILSNLGIKLIAMRCAGYNNVDLKAVWNKIHVVRVPAYSPYSVAEYAISLLMSLTRKIPQAFNRTRDGNFRLDGLTGRDLHGKTAGIIGTGKIGKIAAEILSGFGMNILVYDVYPDTKWATSKGFTYVTLDELFPSSDVVSLHCPLTPETHHIVNTEALNTMKQDAVIINTGRGALIDTKALVEALKDKKIGGAALDVYEEEDAYFYEDWSQAVIRDDILARLLFMPNVIVSSHQAFLTEEALTAIAGTTLQNITDFIDGKELVNEICYKCTPSGAATDCPKQTGKNCF